MVRWTNAPVSSVELSSSIRSTFGLFVAFNALHVRSGSFRAGRTQCRSVASPYSFHFVMLDLTVVEIYNPTLICTSTQPCPWPVCTQSVRVCFVGVHMHTSLFFFITFTHISFHFIKAPSTHIPFGPELTISLFRCDQLHITAVKLLQRPDSMPEWTYTLKAAVNYSKIQCAMWI